MAEATATPCTNVNNVRESEIQFIDGRINLVKHFHACLCQYFASYARKVGCVRDKGDVLAKLMITYSDHETFHPSMKRSLLQFASVLAAVQDYRQKRIIRLEDRIVSTLMKYDDICKSAKADVKYTILSKRKKKRMTHLLAKLKRIPVSGKIIARAEGKVYKASAQAAKNMKAIKELALDFEQKKLTDLQKILLNFVKTEMVFHAKALELYTSAWVVGKRIDVKSDMTEFCEYMVTQSRAFQAVDADVYEEHGSLMGDTMSAAPTADANECVDKFDQGDASSEDEEFIAIVDSLCSRFGRSKNNRRVNESKAISKNNIQNSTSLSGAFSSIDCDVSNSVDLNCVDNSTS